MKDILSYETAVRLKEAGFPQPEPENGQFWYNPDFGPFLVGKLWMVDGRLRNIFYPDTGKVVNKEIRLFPDCVFAPTATDILREMTDVSLRYSEREDCFWVSCWRAAYDSGAIRQTNINSAEAAAQAWLIISEK